MLGGKRDIVKKSCLTILPLWLLAISGYNPIIVPDNATIGQIPEQNGYATTSRAHGRQGRSGR
jgi:hypothetical protein